MISCVNTINILAGNPNPAIFHKLDNLFLQLSSLWFFTVVVGWIFYSCHQISFFTVVVDFFTVVVKIIIIFLQLSSFLKLSLFLQLSSQQSLNISISLSLPAFVLHCKVRDFCIYIRRCAPGENQFWVNLNSRVSRLYIIRNHTDLLGGQ